MTTCMCESGHLGSGVTSVHHLLRLRLKKQQQQRFWEIAQQWLPCFMNGCWIGAGNARQLLAYLLASHSKGWLLHCLCGLHLKVGHGPFHARNYLEYRKSAALYHTPMLLTMMEKAQIQTSQDTCKDSLPTLNLHWCFSYKLTKTWACT